MKTMWGAAAAMLAAFGGTAAEARRSPITDEPMVALIADLPDDSRFQGYGPNAETVNLDLGYSYREMSAFWMPFWAYEDQGVVFFARAADGAPILAEATERELEAVRTVLGRDAVADYRFARLPHMWGWLPTLALIGLALLKLRHDQRRRLAEGII